MIELRSARMALVGLAILGVAMAGYGTASATPAPTAPVAKAAPVTAKPAAAKPAPGAQPAFRLPVGVKSAANMRTCASTACGIVGSASPGQSLVSWCFVFGQNINGNAAWDIVYNASTGRAGFISESLLTNISQNDPCG